MLQSALRLALTAAMLFALFAFFLKRPDEPVVTCATVNSGRNNYKILVVGESWATGGRFFPELQETVSQRLGGRGVEACAIGFSGRSSKLLYFELLEKFPLEKLYGLWDEKKPDSVVLMTGVNDEIQHIGPAAYVEYTKKLVEYFSRVDDVELISVPRVNERSYKSPNLFSRIKRKILMCFYDNCEMQANDVYRIALYRDHPELTVIDYDDFIPRYRGHESCYTADGVHLADQCLHKYGLFVGKALKLAEGKRAAWPSPPEDAGRTPGSSP
jgi:hypothetical protein